MTDIYKKNYLTGLEFLNEAPYAERAQEIKELCIQYSEDVDVAVLDGETLAYMLMEMYSIGLTDGAVAALVQDEEIH
jgi:hypothetical protein